MKGSPKEVGVNFYCSNNNLTTLKGGPKSVGGMFSYNNQLTTLEGCPEIIKGNLIVTGNKLADLDFLPNSMEGTLFALSNPIGSIIGNNVDLDLLRAFNSYKVLKDGVINLKRLKYLMEQFDRPINIEDIKKHYTIK